MTLWEGQDFTVEEGIDALSKAALTEMGSKPWQTEDRDDLGALTVRRWLPDVGLLVYEAADAGQWLTQKGEPAKRARSEYKLHPVTGEIEGGITMDRVSGIANCFDKPQLKRWMADLNVRGGVKAHALGELDEVPEEDWLDRVDFLGLGADAQRDQAAVRGTGVHNLLERLAKGQPVTRDTLREDAQAWYDGAVAAWVALDPVAVEVEQMICHPEDGYAGRPDLVAYVTANGERCLTLLDYKTGKGKVYPEAHYQARLYERARRRCGFEPAERIIIVGVDENGGYTLSEGLVDDSEAEALLRLFRSKQRVERALNDQRKAA